MADENDETEDDGAAGAAAADDDAGGGGGSSFDEDMAAEWAAMIDDEEEEETDSGTSGRVLNQDEIDSLLGFDADDEGGAERTGIRAIIDSALVSYERLPMLEVVFDRLVRVLST